MFRMILYHFWFLSLFVYLFIFGPPSILAQTDNVTALNNKFGIHLAVPSEEDLQEAADLVNSSGGDWGYVTLVIEEKDRKRQRWQPLFDQMRRLHLVPIIRLATFLENGSWRRPVKEEAQAWADFLDSLNWVVKNRYVVLFNEPNRADEWGGQVDPVNYGQVALEFAKKLKEKNPDFFVMLSGFDAAAPHEPSSYENEEIFLRTMLALQEGKEILEYLDGWASHSYPNHGFVGSPWGEGRNSVKTYLWELNLLKSLGLKTSLPVFITETGWPHAEGKIFERSFYSQSEVADNFRIAFDRLQEDPKVIAITPFILNYQDKPFDHFSWRKMGNQKDYYPQYEVVRNLTKVKGEPRQEQKLKIESPLPSKLITGSTYQLPLTIRNEGQAIWSLRDGYQLTLTGLKGEVFEHFFSDLYQLKPFETQTIWLYFKTGQNLGKFDLNLTVAKDGKLVSNTQHWSLEIIPAVDVDFSIRLFPKIKSDGDDFKIIIYNEKEEPIFEKSDLKVENGVGRIKEVKDLAIGEKYRLVILKPYYLPRQGFLTIQDKENKITFERMIPLDFNRDGKFSLSDIWTLITHPKLFSLFWPAN